MSGSSAGMPCTSCTIRTPSRAEKSRCERWTSTGMSPSRKRSMGPTLTKGGRPRRPSPVSWNNPTNPLRSPAAMLRIGPYTLPNPFILAPMAGVSEKPFRVIAFGMGAALCPTELVSSQGLMHANQRTLKYLRFDPEVERPYSLQIFGGDPEAMARAAVIGKEYGAQIIDINMGCPVKKVTKNGAGSALLCEPPRGATLVREIHSATGLPVTCMIRSGWDAHSLNYLQV